MRLIESVNQASEEELCKNNSSKSHGKIKDPSGLHARSYPILLNEIPN
jgi:hypothetical protein